MISDQQIMNNINTLIQDISNKFMIYKKVFYTRLCLYPFYLNDSNFMKLINAPLFMDLNNTETTKKVVDYIKSNNEITLIGTTDFLAFTQVMTPEGIHPICDGILWDGTQHMTDRALKPALFLDHIEKVLV